MRFFSTFKKDKDKLINPDQSGYIKECFIGTNARLIVKLCDYQEKSNDSGIFIFAVVQKAFDFTEGEFLLS